MTKIFDKDLIKAEMQQRFIDGYRFKELEATEIAESKGWTIEPQNIYQIATKIALIGSEVGEALEALREGNPQSEKIPEFSNLEEEFADIVLRIMHLGYRMKLNVPEAIIAKDGYNATRPLKHGGKLF
jgi:NTP pyrophosphatase (non-canonical NTP hydrolase)